MQLPGDLEETPAMCGGILGSECDEAKNLEKIEEQNICMLHPVRNCDAKGMGGLSIAGLQKVDVTRGKTQPLIPGVLGQELL